MAKEENYHEHRRYIRLNTVFPIEYQIYSKDTGDAVSGLKQGFTRNVSEGGMCLEVTHLEDDFINEISSENNELKLFINMPHHKEPIRATANVKWKKKEREDFPNKYLFGVEYTNIQDDIRKQIIAYAKALKRKPKLITASILILMAACGVLAFQVHNIWIKKQVTEKQLLASGSELIKVNEKRLSLENKIYALNLKGQKLKKNLAKSKTITDSLQKRLAKMSTVGIQLSEELTTQKITLEEELTHWNKERKDLLKQLDQLNSSKENLNKELHGIKDLGQTKIVRVRLANDNNIIGQLIDLSEDRLYLKIGLGSIGVDRSTITSIRELSYPEKVDIQKLWQKQEDEAKKDQEEYEKYMAEQRAKGLVYLNGKWIKEAEAKTIEANLKAKEEEVFRIIAQQKNQTVSPDLKRGLLEKLLQKETKPIITIKDKRVYVNGSFFFIKGVAYGIEYPGTNGSIDTYKHVPLSLFEKDFSMMKEAGINTIRTYEPLPEKLLDLAEKYDIMVIENVCYPSGNTDFNSRVHLDILKEQIQRYVTRDRDRKCILMWSIWNDAPWAWAASGNVVKRYGFGKVNNFLKELYGTAKECDISHPITASNAINIEGERLGWDFLDVIGLNLYLGGYDWFVEAEAQKNIAEAKSIEDKYNKPVVILETGFSTFVTGQNQADVLEKQIKIAGTNLSGITIFQWADGWQKAGNKDKLDEHIEEHWGILDGYRSPKPGYQTVSKLFNFISTESYGYTEENQQLTKKQTN